MIVGDAACRSASQFLYHVTPETPWPEHALPRCRVPERLPVVLSACEVDEFFQHVSTIRYRAALMTAYEAGLPVSEVVALQLGDIDSQRMLLHVRQGKGKEDRYAMLSPRLLANRCRPRAGKPLAPPGSAQPAAKESFSTASHRALPPDSANTVFGEGASCFRLIEAIGWRHDRTDGSHKIMKRTDGPTSRARSTTPKNLALPSPRKSHKDGSQAGTVIAPPGWPEVCVLAKLGGWNQTRAGTRIAR